MSIGIQRFELTLGEPGEWQVLLDLSENGTSVSIMTTLTPPQPVTTALLEAAALQRALDLLQAHAAAQTQRLA